MSADKTPDVGVRPVVQGERAEVDKTTIYEGVLGQTIRVDRRRSDGMVWLRIDDSDTSRGRVIALDSDQAWGLARALMQAPDALADGEVGA